MVTWSFVCLLTQIVDNTSSWKVFSWCFCQSGLTMATPLLLKVSRFKSSYFPYYFTKAPRYQSLVWLLSNSRVTSVGRVHVCWAEVVILTLAWKSRCSISVQMIMALLVDGSEPFSRHLFFFLLIWRGCKKPTLLYIKSEGRRSERRCGKSSHGQGRGRYRPAISGASCCRVPLICGEARKIKYTIPLRSRCEPLDSQLPAS